MAELRGRQHAGATHSDTTQSDADDQTRPTLQDPHLAAERGGATWGLSQDVELAKAVEVKADERRTKIGIVLLNAKEKETVDKSKIVEKHVTVMGKSAKLVEEEKAKKLTKVRGSSISLRVGERVSAGLLEPSCSLRRRCLPAGAPCSLLWKRSQTVNLLSDNYSV